MTLKINTCYVPHPPSVANHRRLVAASHKKHHIMAYPTVLAALKVPGKSPPLRKTDHDITALPSATFGCSACWRFTRPNDLKLVPSEMLRGSNLSPRHRKTRLPAYVLVYDMNSQPGEIRGGRLGRPSRYSRPLKHTYSIWCAGYAAVVK